MRPKPELPEGFSVRSILAADAGGSPTLTFGPRVTPTAEEPPALTHTIEHTGIVFTDDAALQRAALASPMALR